MSVHWINLLGEWARNAQPGDQVTGVNERTGETFIITAGERREGAQTEGVLTYRADAHEHHWITETTAASPDVTMRCAWCPAERTEPRESGA